MTENPQLLGSGIATVHSETPLLGNMRVVYEPTEEGFPLLRSLGIYALSDERQAAGALQVGKLGVSKDGNVWNKGENGQAMMVVSQDDLLHALQVIQENEPESTLNEFGDETGKRILVRTLPKDGSKKTFQIWLVKDPKNMQHLLDAVYCLHFHKPATDDHEVLLTEDQILQEALRIGITFDATIEGKPLLSHLPQK